MHVIVRSVDRNPATPHATVVAEGEKVDAQATAVEENVDADDLAADEGGARLADGLTAGIDQPKPASISPKTLRTMPL